MTLSRAQMRRQLYAGGGKANLQAARDVLQAEALPGEFLAYINPQEAAMLKYMGGAGEPINQSGIPSFFLKKVFKSAKKAVSGITDAVTDFAKSDIGQIALMVAAPYALGPAFASMGLSGAVGGSAFLGNALRAGITNLALQGVTTGKFNLGQAAKAGVIGGAVNTGIQNYRQTGSAFKPGQVTEGGQILESTVTPDATVDFEGVQYSDAAPTSTRYQDFAPRVGSGTEQTFGITPQTTTPTTSLSSTGDNIFTGAFANEQYDLPAAAVGMENIEGKYGQTIGTRFTDPATNATSVIKGGGVENISLADRAGQFSTSVQDVFKEGATISQRATSAVDAIKQISGAAIDRPLSTLTVASLISAASVPKQPEESEFDYEERVSLVNDFASKYGKLAGVDMSNLGNISDFESYYKQRANVAFGGLPEIPTGQPRQNQGGITELDYRDTGGFVPVGIKEKADDVPAMLSKNEFVFTADAVRNAGNGDVDKGAQKLYNVMKTLENGGTV